MDPRPDTAWVGPVEARRPGMAIAEVADTVVEARLVMIEVPRGLTGVGVEGGGMVLRLGMVIAAEVDIVVDRLLVMVIEALLLGVMVVVVGITVALRHWRGKEIVVGEDMGVVIGRGGDRAAVVLNEGEVDIDGTVHFLNECITLIKNIWQEKGSSMFHFNLPRLICVCVTGL